MSVGAALWSAGGCSAAPRDVALGEGGGGSAVSSTTAEAGSGGSAVATTSSGAAEFGGAGPEDPGPPIDVDADGDGFTLAEGDCNDGDRNVNPGAIEVEVLTPDGQGDVPEPADEDCDGIVDNVLPACDTNIAPADFDAIHGANAIDLCAVASPDDRRWGVLSARYVRGDGSPAQPTPAVGVLDAFGPNVHVQGGRRMLVLSSGHARVAGWPGACNNVSCTTYGPGEAPPGFPQDNPDCPPSSNINDDIGLELVLRAPTNATGYEFAFKFYTFEYPEFVCESFNDQFLALATPAPPGSVDGNLSFDSLGNPVSVNIGFFDVCEGCPLGTDELEGTGFGLWNDAGATSWLRTQAPVKGGEELTLRFQIFDTGDEMRDSTALIDGFKWVANGGTVAVETTPIEDPR
ncbi:putative metal-binding motif-containing protein [Sorangium cellulosum]|uniref:putative metal-binding motif-containing protein n=1 Tax=Sorangium cellulosum TaxID=56 RepID=UPI001F3CE902|nr:choice-of-anchor L domain-containing protein [Sorangium cellulosum]